MDHSSNLQARTSDLVKTALYTALPTKLLFRRGEDTRNEFALTFDDGPSAEFTLPTLEILRNYSVRATFFLIGNQAERFPALVRSIAGEGHELGSHSYSHPYFNRLSWSDAVREIDRSKEVLEQLTGQACRLFRPPYGKLSIQSLVPAWRRGQSVVNWTIDLKDYSAQSAFEIERQLTPDLIRDGDIILYHATNVAGLTALPKVIEAAQSRGRKGEVVSRMAGLRAKKYDFIIPVEPNV